MDNITKKDLEARLQEKNMMEGELKNIILNYEDYKTGYVNSIYQFRIDSDIFYVACNYEGEGLDLIINHLENEGLEGRFIQVREDNEVYIIDVNNDRYYSDEYIVGGNHGRYLYHAGNFTVEELNI